jgi:putative two-component system response regulator
MVSGRRYKNGFTNEEAVRIISEGKGTHFEPVLVDLFLKVADEFNNIAKSFK